MNHKGKTWNTWKRLLSYIIGRHKVLFGAVVVCILVSSCTTVVSSLFLEVLIDDFITPMLGGYGSDFEALLQAMLFIACVYVCGDLQLFI